MVPALEFLRHHTCGVLDGGSAAHSVVLGNARVDGKMVVTVTGGGHS